MIYTKYTHTNIRKTLITTCIFISECGPIVAAGIYNLPSSTIHLTFTLFLSKHPNAHASLPGGVTQIFMSQESGSLGCCTSYV